MCAVLCVLCVIMQLVSACVVLLSGPHDRSRLPAMQLLQALAACPLQVCVFGWVMWLRAWAAGWARVGVYTLVYMCAWV